MQETKLEPVNLGSVAHGALLEHFNICARKVADNIADASTPSTAKRKITIELEFEPDADRRGIKVTASATCKLASVEPHKSRLYTGKGVDGKVYLFDEDPRQEMLFAPPDKDQNVINFNQGRAGENAG